MKTWLLNAFSLSMLGSATEAVVSVRRVSLEEASALAAGATSAVGHADTAALMSRLLGREIEARRTTVVLGPGDVALVAQYTGPRLPEGATELPAGAAMAWFVVTLGSLQ